MDWLTCLVLLSIFHQSISKDCVIDNRSLDLQWEEKLRKDIDKCYKDEAPSNKTFVNIRIVMKYFTVNDEDGSFFMYTWTTLTWTDERLKWNPENYNGIKESYFWSYDYWVPMLVQKNRADEDDFLFYGICKIGNNGHVVCVPRMENRARCVSYVRDWPYDTLNCTLDLGISEYQKNVILVPRTNKTVTTLGAEYGAEWSIIDYDESHNTSDTVQITVTFTLERNAEGLGAVIIFPAILLGVLTILTFFKDVDNFTRFWLTFFAVLCHAYFLTVISSKMPRRDIEVPKIVVFCRFSLFLSSILVIVNSRLKRLRNRKTTPPQWIGSVNNLILNSYGKYLYWPRWETEKDGGTSDSANVKNWNDFANILNNVCLMFSVMAYFILFFAYVPRPPPLTF